MITVPAESYVQLFLTARICSDNFSQVVMRGKTWMNLVCQGALYMVVLWAMALQCVLVPINTNSFVFMCKN